MTVILVPEIGTWELKTMKCDDVIGLGKDWYERETV